MNTPTKKTIRELLWEHECIKCMLLLEVAFVMNNTLALPDDCANADARSDKMLCQQLEEYAGIYFYESCDRYTQSLLSSCEWHITTNSSALTLVITCPDSMVNWRVLKNIGQIGRWLEQLTSSAKIRVCPPIGMGTPSEIRVDELSVYQDSIEDEPYNFFLPTGISS